MTEKNIFQGVAPIVQTPFLDTGEIDYESLENIVDVSISEGVDGLILFGISSEFYKLRDEERLSMVKTVVKKVNGRVPVVASVTHNCTYGGVLEAKAFEKAGADIIMCFPPHVQPVPADKLLAHLKAIADAVNRPFLIQYSPELCGSAVSPQMICDLSKVLKNQLYVKAEPDNVRTYCEEVYGLSEGKIGMFMGYNGLHMIDLMKRGVTGIMPGTSTLKAYVKVMKVYQSGDMEEAVRLYNIMLPFIAKISVNNEHREDAAYFEKLILKRRGIIKSAHMREPALITTDPVVCDAYVETREKMLQMMGLRD